MGRWLFSSLSALGDWLLSVLLLFLLSSFLGSTVLLSGLLGDLFLVQKFLLSGLDFSKGFLGLGLSNFWSFVSDLVDLIQAETDDGSLSFFDSFFFSQLLTLGVDSVFRIKEGVKIDNVYLKVMDDYYFLLCLLQARVQVIFWALTYWG